MTEEEIFSNALEIADHAERRAWLDKACMGNLNLRAAIDELLALHDTAGGFLDTPALGHGLEDTDEQPGCVIDRYRLVRRIGEGGFGVVWRAEQFEPVKRDVALKIIKLGRNSADIISRFAGERQSLAMMNHPNIATVLDAGTLGDGSFPDSGAGEGHVTAGHSRPYFVMELVDGLAVDKFCDEHQLSLSSRLQLFLTVCRGVQHAHQKGIVHRDLKPSNLLVAQDGGIPIPKVIDFGIAKAMHEESADSPYTVVGTPAYMSPEQFKASADIDIRADIYALGGVLYKLITGTAPFKTVSLNEQSPDAIHRMVCEDLPELPSKRLAVAQSEKNGLNTAKRDYSRLRDDLDWVVMKAVAKQRTDRYESVSELARDIERSLADEPVSAAPPSSVYRASKFIRRNRLPVAALTMISAALIVGGSLATFGLIKAEKGRKQAEQEKQIAQQERNTARSMEDRALAEAEKAVRFARMLEDIIVSAGPEHGNPANFTMREQLEQFAGSLTEQLQDHPEYEARLQRTIGRLYLTLREARKAEPHLTRAIALRRRVLGSEHSLTTQSQVDQATCLFFLGRLQDAEQAARAALDSLRKQKPGAELIEVMGVLSKICRARDDFESGAELLQEMWTVAKQVYGVDHSVTIQLQGRAALMIVFNNDPDEADQLSRDALTRIQHVRPGSHVDVAAVRLTHGRVLFRQRNHAEAEDNIRKAIEIYQTVMGDDSFFVVDCMTTLAQILRADKRSDEALAVARTAVAAAEQGAMDGDMKRIVAYSLLADMTRAVDLNESVDARSKAIEARRRLVPDHPQLPQTMLALSRSLWQLNQLDKAIEQLRAALEMQKRIPNSTDRLTIYILHNLSELLSETGKPVEAEKYLSDAISMTESGATPQIRPVLQIDQVQALVEAKKHEEVCQLVDALVTHAEDGKIEAAVAKAAQCQLLMAESDYSAAEKILHAEVARLRKSSKNRRTTGRISGLYAECLLTLEKFEEAETSLREDRRRVQARVFQPLDRRRIIRQTIKLYEAWQKPEEALRWRKQLVPDSSAK